MLTFEIVVKSILGIFYFLALFYIVGYVSFKLLKKTAFQNIFQQVFWCSLTGLLQVVSIYAIVRTSFQTVLLPVPFLLIFLISKTSFLAERQDLFFSRKSILLFILAASAIYFLYYIQAYVSWDASYLSYATGDHAYYARVAEYMNMTGKENNGLEYLYLDRFSVLPYHYGDIWLCAFVSWLLHMKPIFVLILVVYPLLAILFTLGLAGFVVNRFPAASRKSYNWIFILVFSAYFSGFDIFFLRYVLPDHVFVEAAAGYPKTLWVSCFLIGSLYLTNAKHINALLIFIAIAGLTFINIFPPLLVGAFLWLLIVRLSKVIQLKLKSFLPGLVSVLFALAYLFLFYMLLSVSDPSASATSNDITSLFGVKVIIKAIKIWIRGSLQITVLTPFLVLLLITLLKEGHNFKTLLRASFSYEAMWMILLPIAGLFCWGSLYVFNPADSIQFFHNIFIPLVAIIISLIMYRVFILPQFTIMKVVVLGLSVLVLAKNRLFDFDIEEMKRQEWLAVNQFLDDRNNIRFATYKNMDEFTSVYDKNTRLRQALGVLNYIYEPFVNESLNAPFIKINPVRMYGNFEQSLISLTSFDYFIKKNGIGNKEQMTEDKIANFVESKAISYVIASSQAKIPHSLYALVKDSLILSDSGWKIYKVR